MIMDAIGTFDGLYRIYEAPDAIRVERVGRPDAHIRLEKTRLVVSSENDEKAFGLFDYKNIAETAAVFQMKDWRPLRRPWPGIKTWETVRGLAPRLSEPWRRLVKKADSKILSVQRSVFSATLGVAPLTLEECFYRHSYLVSDVTKYRAAAIAVREIDRLGKQAFNHRIHRSAEMGYLRSLIYHFGGHVQVRPDMPEKLTLPAAMSMLENWLGLFSSDGESYTSLNRTLMHLPGRLPSWLLCFLAKVRLPFPIIDRLQLMVLLWHAARENHRHRNVFLHASRSDIRRAAALTSEYLCEPLAPEKIRGVSQFVDFLCLYPDHHDGGIVGLAEKAIRWHRMVAIDPDAVDCGPVDRKRPTCQPPVSLPDNEGIRFLQTVGEVVAEGARMRHCAASYVEKALLGKCFLFHVHHGGEDATIEVNRAGQILQAQGPRNRPNRAARWGRKVLSVWGGKLRESTGASQVADPDECSEDIL